MTFNKRLRSSSLARAGSVLSALVIATFLFVGSLATVQQTAATTLTEEEQDVLDTQDSATDNLSERDRDVNGIEFTPRWGGVTTLQPNQLKVLFADCLEDEFAVSYMNMFETEDVIAFQSFPWAFPDDTMSWIAVVQNTDSETARVASIGVICADENRGREDDVNIDIRVKNTIQNTVNQVIEQSANQILNANTTNPTTIQQTIDQTAQQQGVISGGSTLEQDIDQDAGQAADVTGGAGGTTVDQGIDQDADQSAGLFENLFG